MTMQASAHKIIDYKVISDKEAILVASVTKRGFGNEVKHMESQLPRLRIVAGSMRTISEGPLEKTIKFHVFRKVEAQPNTDIARARMQTLSHNVYMDDEDQVWETNGGVLLRKDGVETAEHLEQLLADCRGSITRETLAVASAMKVYPSPGDYVIVAHNGESYHGYVVAMTTEDMIVIPYSDVEHPFRCKAANTIEIVGLPDEPTLELAENSSPTLEYVLDYYKKVYGYNDAYYQKLADLIKSRAQEVGWV